MKVSRTRTKTVTQTSSLQSILKTKSELYHYFSSISLSFRLSVYLSWVNQLLIIIKRLFFVLTFLIPLSKNVRVLRILARRGTAMSLTNIIVSFCVAGSRRSPIYTPYFLYISGALHIISILYSMYSKVVFATLTKKLYKLVLLEQEKYVISKSHQDYINYMPPKDRSGSILVLVNELTPLWDSFLLFNPVPLVATSLALTGVIVRLDLPQLISLSYLCMDYFLNLFIIVGVCMWLFYSYYVKVLVSQTKSQLISYKLFDAFIELLSDFSTKIMSAYALNVVEGRHAKLSNDLSGALKTQQQIDHGRLNIFILEGLLESYIYISVSLFLYTRISRGLTMSDFFVCLCLYLVNQIYYMILDYALKNYKFNTIYRKVHTALELSVQGDRNKYGQISCIKEDTPSDVVVKDLSFTLDEGQEPRTILSDVSFTIKKGQKVALIGPSGSGKSTLMKLYAGFMGPIPEVVPVDPLWNARTNTMLLTQDPVFYIGSVAENIAGFGGKLDPDYLSKVGVTEFMLNKTLSYDARELSGGEKQRIALSRALHVLAHQKCSTLILDEAFSALDPSNKKKCLDLIFNVYADKTIIVINHDPSILKNFSKIIYLVGGKLKFCDTYLKFKESPLYEEYLQ